MLCAHFLVNFSQIFTLWLFFCLIQHLWCFIGPSLCCLDHVTLKRFFISLFNDLLSFYCVLIKTVLDFELLKFVSSLLVIWSLEALTFVFVMLHLFLFIVMVDIIFVWVTESLVCSELLLNHALQHSIMREFLLQLNKLFANFPFVLGFG